MVLVVVQLVLKSNPIKDEPFFILISSSLCGLHSIVIGMILI